MNKLAFRFKKGMVLVVVTAAILMMMIIVVGILSRNTSRVTTSDADVKRIQAGFLAKGVFWKGYQNPDGPSTGSVTETVNGVNYIVTTTNGGPGSWPGNKITVNVSY